MLERRPVLYYAGTWWRTLQNAMNRPCQPVQQKPMGSCFDLYASGINGMSLRCTLRKAAQEKWAIGVTDVSTAFLLAPRKSSRLMVTKPPSILVEAGLVESDIRWVIEKAVYGLDTSPSLIGKHTGMKPCRICVGGKMVCTTGWFPLRNPMCGGS